MLKERDLLRRSSSFDLLHFQRHKLLGQGTFGKVYLAVNRQTHEELAMKEVVQHPHFKSRELSILSQLHHPNIVELKHYFTTATGQQTTLHLLMQKMETSLAAILKEQRKCKTALPSRTRKLIAFQLLKGLAYLQSRYICHRDLKPPNILVNTSTYQVKICDFGSAKAIEVRENNVSYICSRYYRAPELILNSTTYGCEIDMWSVGCIIVELMTLEPIFPGDSSLEQLIEIIKILGTPSAHHLLACSPLNSGLQLPVLRGTDWSKILRRYCPDQAEVDLIRRILTYDTKERIKPLDALKHPYFADLPSYEQAQQLPELFQFEGLKGKKNKKTVGQVQQLFDQYILKETSRRNGGEMVEGKEEEQQGRPIIV